MTEEATIGPESLVTTPEAFFARPEVQQQIAGNTFSYVGDMVRSADFSSVPGAQVALLHKLNDEKSNGDPITDGSGWQERFRQQIPVALGKVNSAVQDFCDHGLSARAKADYEFAQAVKDADEVYGYVEGEDQVATQCGPVTKKDLMTTKAVAAVVSMAAYHQLVEEYLVESDRGMKGTEALRKPQPGKVSNAEAYAEENRARVLLGRQGKMGAVADRLFQGETGPFDGKLIGDLMMSVSDSGTLNGALNDYRMVARADRKEKTDRGLDQDGQPYTRRGRPVPRLVHPGVGDGHKRWLKKIESADRPDGQVNAEVVPVPVGKSPDAAVEESKLAPASEPDVKLPEEPTNTGGGMNGTDRPSVLDDLTAELTHSKPRLSTTTPLSERIRKPSSTAKG